MKAIITNKLIVLKSPTPDVVDMLNDKLSYSDKAAQYKLRRMAKNPWAKKSPYYKKLQQEVNGNLLYDVGNGNYAMSSGFEYIIRSIGIPVEDRRCDTGQKISLPWAKKPHPLRDYQEEARQLMLGHRRGVVNFATGLGKTLLSVHFIRDIQRRSLIVAPSESIAMQFHSDLEKAFGEVKVGFFGGGKKKLKDITVGIAASVNNHPDVFKNHDLGLVIMDEVHHVPATTFYSISQALGDVGHMFGLTATDYRTDGKDIMIAGGCGDVLIRRDIRWGVENKWLANPIFIVKKIDTTHMRNYKDDKIKNYKEHVLNCRITKETILNDIKHYMGQGKAVLCLVDEVAHGEELSQQLGIPFATGRDKKSQSYVDALNAHKIPGLIGTDGKVGEGTDTRNVDVLVLANFVASKGPVIQAIGRGLRKEGLKTDCIILDYWLTGSDMLSRHAENRIGFYEEITHNIQVV